ASVPRSVPKRSASAHQAVKSDSQDWLKDVADPAAAPPGSALESCPTGSAQCALRSTPAASLAALPAALSSSGTVRNPICVPSRSRFITVRDQLVRLNDRGRDRE